MPIASVDADSDFLEVSTLHGSIQGMPNGLSTKFEAVLIIKL